VWVAPWENANGDLNAPGYVFTEIQPRRWTLGTEADPTQGRVITPLQIEERQAPAVQTPAMPGLPRDMGAKPGDRAPQGFFSS
jgi:conjugal transfer pilus assembly protein TraV